MKRYALPFIISAVLTWNLPAQINTQVLLCGVCRNVAQQLPYTIKIFEKIGALFSDYRILIYENNSTDQTVLLLKQWASRNSRVRITHEKLNQVQLAAACINRLENGAPFRPELIARARNIVLKQALSEQYTAYPFVIWLDMDFSREPDYAGFTEVFSATRTWDAIFAYGVDPQNNYWDWYAIRDHEYPLGSELMGQQWWYFPRRYQLLQPTDDWYPVYSAFGGCGIYRKAALIGCNYSALVTPELGQAAARIMQALPTHPMVLKYHAGLKQLTQQVELGRATEHKFTALKQPDLGIITPQTPPEIVWQMSSSVYNYPSVCEHVTLHAAMILQGHDQLFINPRLVFRYGPSANKQWQTRFR